MRFTSLIYAGHSAVLVRGTNFVVAIDPWFQGNPLCPRELVEPLHLDLIILSHAHSDHAGDAVRLAKKCNCKVIATFELATILIEQGIPEVNVIGLNTGGSTDVSGMRISLTPALHTSSFETDRGARYAGLACGVVISDGKTAIYHAGDTALFSDMQLIKRTYNPQIAFLPIGDYFTMGPAEAVEAAKMIGAATTIPMHYKTFPALVQDPGGFLDSCAKEGLNALALSPGQTFEINPKSTTLA